MAEESAESKQGAAVRDWLSLWTERAGFLLPMLTALSGVFLSERQAKVFAYCAAAVLAVAYALFLYWRSRRRPPPLPPTPPEALDTSILRSFLPFEQGDTLIGRRTDCMDAMVILQGAEFRFGVIWGESGCGKTSFLRAGLVAELRRRGHACIYLGRPSDDPGMAIELAFSHHGGTGRLFVIIDQFEEYFLTHPSHHACSALGNRMRKLLDDHQHCSLVIAIRRDFFARLQNFAPDIPDPTSPRTTFELINLRTHSARQVLAHAAADEAVQFEAALVDAIIEDLESNGEVWPVELQLIGTRLKRAHVREKAVYVALGRKAGVIGTFIRDEITRLPKPVLGEIVLRKLCAPGGIAKSPVDITFDAIVEDVRARDATLLAGGELATCLIKLQEARVVIRTGPDTYNLTHDALAPLIQRGTTGLQGAAEAADRSISFYLGAFRNDSMVRIPIRTLLQIRRHATPQILADRLVRELMAKSWLSAAFALSWPAAMAVLVLVVGGYVFAFRSWSIGTGSVAFASVPPSVVIRFSTPFTRILPGTDKVAVETSFDIDQLDPTNITAITQVPRGDIWGIGGTQDAVAHIADVLDPLEKIRFLRIAGKPKEAAAAFAAFSRGKQGAFRLREASDAIGLAGRANDEKDTDEVAEVLIRILGVTPSPPDLQSQLAAAAGLLRIAETRAGVADRMTLNLQQSLAIFRQQSIYKKSTRLGPLFDAETYLIEAAIEQLLLNGISQPTEGDLKTLEMIIDDSESAPLARVGAFGLLESYAARNESLALPVLRYLLKITIRQTVEFEWWTYRVVDILQIILRSHPHAAEHASITELLTSAQAASAKNNNLESSLIALSLFGSENRPAFSARLMETLRERLGNPETRIPNREVALIALSHLVAANPGLQNSQTTRLVADLLHEADVTGSHQNQVGRQPLIYAAAKLAASGQLDTECAQLALNLLAHVLNDNDAKFQDTPVYPLDVELKHLLSAGARLTPQMMDAVVRVIGSSSLRRKQFVAAEILIAVARTHPQEVLRRQSTVDKAVLDREFDRTSRLLVLAAFGQADAVTGSDAERLARCKNLLAARDRVDGWRRGAFCAFFFALDHPTAQTPLQIYLKDMSEGGTGERMAARMTLEMLVTAQRVVEARNNSSLLPMTRARLRYDLGDQERHVAIAARAGLIALDNGF
ncbi:nSTAND1 domain-containing NTPase [Janthinobacterium sp. 1_2014MBL_MicDiv]|uniref:nSTAND1 domain-containing NTPase n=1 Tax=Janthinobacterium sp. 1_2014MBL_MicDiv TaxID=1644131 RepID=UPI0008F48BDD|nr:hypothetical protein [Janthinobacterium sp. 1_2014MBL_MicDiv]APA68009.1 hypothetical protein YQ44_09340 [Janthinobacterium sp. 1_2014MBL_MicDiv]